MKSLSKITDKKIIYIFTICILFFIPLLKQLSFYLVKLKVIYNDNSINPAYVLYFSIPFLIYLYIKDIKITKRRLEIYDYLFYLLIITGLITTVFSIDKNISLFGKYDRNEGLLSISCYYLLFIAWKQYATREDIKKIINIFLIIAIINSIYALFQIYTPFKFILRYGADKQMASGLCGNPNFFGSLIVTVLSIVTTKILIYKKIYISQILFVVLLFISLINSQSTGPFIAYMLTILFIIIYLFIKKYIVKKNIFYLCLILLITYISIFFINKYMYKYEKCEMCDFANSITNNVNVDSDYRISNGRIDIWKDSLDIAKGNLITGVGYDNFYLAYYDGINLSQVTFTTSDNEIKESRYSEILDNAHNVYLHILVSSGLLNLIPYLLLCLLTFIRGLKAKDNLSILLLGGFVSYSIQAFANISVIQVAPIYYIIIGLILSINE